MTEPLPISNNNLLENLLIPTIILLLAIAVYFMYQQNIGLADSITGLLKRVNILENGKNYSQDGNSLVVDPVVKPDIDEDEDDDDDEDDDFEERT